MNHAENTQSVEVARSGRETCAAQEPCAVQAPDAVQAPGAVQVPCAAQASHPAESPRSAQEQGGTAGIPSSAASAEALQIGPGGDLERYISWRREVAALYPELFGAGPGK